jgi:hypothetical protein
VVIPLEGPVKKGPKVAVALCRSGEDLRFPLTSSRVNQDESSS